MSVPLKNTHEGQTWLSSTNMYQLEWSLWVDTLHDLLKLFALCPQQPAFIQTEAGVPTLPAVERPHAPAHPSFFPPHPGWGNKLHLMHGTHTVTQYCPLAEEVNYMWSFDRVNMGKFQKPPSVDSTISLVHPKSLFDVTWSLSWRFLSYLFLIWSHLLIHMFFSLDGVIVTYWYLRRSI